MDAIQKVFKGLLDQLAALVQRKPLPTPRVNQAPQLLPQSITYERFLTQIDGADALIEVTLDYQDTAPLASHPDLLELIVRLINPDVSGLATPQEEQQVFELRNSVLVAMQGAIYVGSVTAGGLQNAYFYVPQGSIVPESLRSINTGLQFSYEIRPDNGWQYYRELMPTLEEGERLANERQIQDLVDRGINVAIQQFVQHIISGQLSALSNIQQNISNMGYQIISVQNSINEPGLSELVFGKLTNLQLESITTETIELTRLAGQNQLLYVGWDVSQSSQIQPTQVPFPNSFQTPTSNTDYSNPLPAANNYNTLQSQPIQSQPQVVQSSFQPVPQQTVPFSSPQPLESESPIQTEVRQPELILPETLSTPDLLPTSEQSQPVTDPIPPMIEQQSQPITSQITTSIVEQNQPFNETQPLAAASAPTESNLIEHFSPGNNINLPTEQVAVAPSQFVAQEAESISMSPAPLDSGVQSPSQPLPSQTTPEITPLTQQGSMSESQAPLTGNSDGLVTNITPQSNVPQI